MKTQESIFYYIGSHKRDKGKKVRCIILRKVLINGKHFMGNVEIMRLRDGHRLIIEESELKPYNN